MSDNYKKQECLAMLNRMGTLIWESGGLPIILDLLEDGSVDRQLLASILRTSGKEGEELLIKILRHHKNYKVRMAAASVLSYRLYQNNRHMLVQIKLDSSEVVELNAIPPGQICKYIGKVSSVISDETAKLEGEELFDEDAFVEVNSRDFLASLHRLLALNSDYFRQQFDADEERLLIPQMLTSQLLYKFEASQLAFDDDCFHILQEMQSPLPYILQQSMLQ
mmetsp:Transcript_21256/g.20406  ORF Transcript_21256/g.20406 Transcript_21256/m.20406 type:complete len:222 (+) Transcript_21256:1480-2145(+)